MVSTKNPTPPSHISTNYLQTKLILPDSPKKPFIETINNNNTIYANLVNPSPQQAQSIREYYRNSCVFITGATGFVGKAVLEKLLRSCGDEVASFYLLVRPKRGLSVDKRLVELLRNPVFDRVREKCPERFDKVKVVSGDVTQLDLGLNAADKQELLANITITFHSAATIRFNESLKDALILNTLGTKRVVEICRGMKKLKSFVHVSTAFSNANRRDIDETVYPPIYDPKKILECLDSLTDEALNSISDKLKGQHPNTYTLTKSMAEYIVMEQAGDLPVAIVRPSIVTAAWREPFPGWVDNICGITGIMMEIGRGTIRSIVCDETLTMDLIPVDIVANMLITVAWHISFNRSNSLRVYNCTSGQLNGIKWNEFGRLTMKYAIENPSKYVLFYPGFKYRTNRIIHQLCEVFLHMIPAFIVDIIMRCSGQKPIMLKICNKFRRAVRNGEYFALHEWNFQNDNVALLVDDLKRNTYDGEDFDCNIQNGFNWDPYVKSYMLGIRKFVLKDDMDSMAGARTKLQRLYWAHKIFQSFSIYLIMRYTLWS